MSNYYFQVLSLTSNTVKTPRQCTEFCLHVSVSILRLIPNNRPLYKLPLAMTVSIVSGPLLLLLTNVLGIRNVMLERREHALRHECDGSRRANGITSTAASDRRRLTETSNQTLDEFVAEVCPWVFECFMQIH